MTKHRAGVWMMREEAWPVEEIPSTTRELLGRLDPIRHGSYVFINQEVSV